MTNTRDTILLFDVDGTLTPSRLVVTAEMAALLKELRKYYYIGIVGGSDFHKQQEQLAPMGDIKKEFDFVFSENGLDAYQNGELLARQNIAKYFGEENLKKIINFTLRALSEIDCPVKRGNFIEYRNGMLNVCPVGRSCSQAEREEFEQYDKIHNIRPALAAKLEEQFKELKLRCAIGGQISVDVFPEGWDKTYCLRYIEKQFPQGKVHFFGDKTTKGGNDYEIYVHPHVTGHSVKTWQDTYNILKEEFLKSKQQ